LNLIEHGYARPRRIGHEVLHALSVSTVHAPIDVGKIPFYVHRQLRSQVGMGVLARVARARPKTRLVAPPQPIQARAEIRKGFRAQAPPLRVKYILLEGR
jgi:hypothetical protein